MGLKTVAWRVRCHLWWTAILGGTAIWEIPIKMLEFATGVNMTVGLPIIRTSIDHGMAFDIAGLGTADDSSLEAACSLALLLARNNMRKREKIWEYFKIHGK